MPRMLCTLVLILTVSSPAAAQQADRARAVAPFLEEQTFAVMHIDLRRLDAEALLKKAAALAPKQKDELAAMQQAAAHVLKMFRAGGAEDVYFLASLRDLPFEAPLVVIPLAKGEGKEIMQLLRMFPLGEVEKVGSALVVGKRAALQRLQGRKPVAVPELSQALAAAEESAVQVAVFLPASLRRALDEVAPRLPAEIGGGSLKPVTHGLRWLAIGADVTPKLSLHVTAQAASAAEAKQLLKMADDALQALAKHPAAKALLPMPEKARDLLKPRLDGERLTLNLDEQELTEILLPLLEKAGESQRRAQSMNNLKQIALALHNYHDRHKHFPAHASYDKKGQPLLSWRVHLLPYLDQDALYKEFHLDEPWDSPHNKKLIARMPAVFRDPLSKVDAGKTVYLAPVAKETIFPPGPQGVSMKDITDGTSITIFVVEADEAHAVEWTRPADLPVDRKQPLAGLAGKDCGWFLAAFADGSVRTISRSIAPATLWALFTRNGGEAPGNF